MSNDYIRKNIKVNSLQKCDSSKTLLSQFNSCESRKGVHNHPKVVYLIESLNKPKAFTYYTLKTISVTSSLYCAGRNIN